MAKIDINGDGKADISVNMGQVITLVGILVSMIGSYYTLNNRIALLEDEVAKLNYNQKEYTWKAQRQLEADFRTMELEVKGFMKDLEYLQKDKKK